MTDTPAEASIRFSIRSCILSSQFSELADLLRSKSIPTDILIIFATWSEAKIKEKLRVFSKVELDILTDTFNTYWDFYQRTFMEISNRHSKLPMIFIKDRIEWGRKNPEEVVAIKDLLKNPQITPALFERLVTPSSSEDHPALEYIVSHRNCPIWILELGSRSDILQVRRDVAGNRRISKVIMSRLVNDREWSVQVRLVRNPSVPLEVISPLVQSRPDGRIHRRLNIYVLKALAKRLSSDIERDTVIRELERRSTGRESKLLVAQYTKDSERVEELCLGDDLNLREAAALNVIASEEGKVAVALLDPRFSQA